jgi:hypothetical protein
LKQRFIIPILLWGFLLMGLYGAISVSLKTITQTAPCPQVMGVHVCYVILICYSLMVLAQLMRQSLLQNVIFYGAWAVVFGVALFASVLEFGNGQTCPKSSTGFAMCYASLLLSGSIGLLFWYSKRLASPSNKQSS